MPADFQRISKKYDAGYFVKHASFDLHKAKGSYHTWDFPLDRSTHNIKMDGPMPFPASMGTYSSPDIIIDEQHALAPKIQEQIDNEQQLSNERDDLRSRIWGLLNSVTTLEKLIEVAPELSGYMPEPPARSTLPVVQVGKLVTDLMAAGLKIPAEK
jgi:hypothetical protein